MSEAHKVPRTRQDGHVSKGHAHESWQIHYSAWVGLYCAACGETVGGKP
jgi:hypothetical protein